MRSDGTMNTPNPFDQLDAQSLESRLAQVSTSELADAHNPLDADKLPRYYCPFCERYTDDALKHRKQGPCCVVCMSKLILVNSCFEPPAITH